MADFDLDALEREAKVAWDIPSDAVENLIKGIRQLKAQVANLEVRNADLRERLIEADKARDRDENRIAAQKTLIEMKEARIDEQEKEIKRMDDALRLPTFAVRGHYENRLREAGREIKALRKETGHLQQFGRKQAWRAKQAEEALRRIAELTDQDSGQEEGRELRAANRFMREQHELDDSTITVLRAEKEQLRLTINNLNEQLQAYQAHATGVMRLKEAADRAAGKAEEEIATYLTRLQGAYEALDKYAWHRPTCAHDGNVDAPCNCGLAEVMGALNRARLRVTDRDD